ncbi:MAG: tetratricopeptide repeat protein [Alphaproteobacteria bacterium]|nr:tetratricopeptide repeat protein [Alphaproteobacteria bacterium]
MDLTKSLSQAIAAHQRGDLDEAAGRYRAILRKHRRHFDALHLLGTLHHQRGQHEQAVELIVEAIRINDGFAPAHFNHANALRALGRLEEALAGYDRGLEARPDDAEALNNRGVILAELRRPGPALDSFERAIRLRPDYADALNNRGNALKDLLRPEEALACYDAALRIRPGYLQALTNRANVLKELKRFDLALASFDRALAADPTSVEALANRGVMLMELGRHGDAAASFAAAIAIEPDHPYARGNLLHCRMSVCDWRDFDAQVAEISAAVGRGRPADTPFSFLAVSDSPSDQLLCAEACVRDRSPANPMPPVAAAPGDRERIHLAYLSADFRDHAVAFLTAGLFEHHDRRRFEVTALSFSPEAQTEMGRRLGRAFDRFIDIRRMSDGDVGDSMRTLGVDIAVDLMGHTSGARTGILARRAAPIQVGYLGYPGSIGADYIDYVIGDRFVVPSGAEAGFVEKIVYLPDTFQANDDKRAVAARTPSRTEAGLPDAGFVFCAFSNAYKITPAMFDLWVRLLAGVEGSVLWLVATAEAAAANLRRECAACGVDPRRLVFAGRLPYPDHLARYRLADLFLDTLPFNGGTTASDALWAGLPVLTCSGAAFAARMAGSLLHAVGLPELIAPSLPAYERIALALAREPGALAMVKAKLAANRKSSALFDTARFCRHLESAYVAMWARHRRGERPESFEVSRLE